MKKILPLLIIPFLSFGQGWEQTFGGDGFDEGHSVQQTTDGGYIITGCTAGVAPASGLISLIKTDVNGDQQWVQTFGWGQGRAVQQTIDGGYIIVGHEGVSGKVLWIKTDENGNEQWAQMLDAGSGTEDYASYGRSVHQTTDGGYIISGHIYIQYYSTNFPDALLIRIDENGNQQWLKTFDGEGWLQTSSEYGFSAQQTIDGGYIVCGASNSNGNGNADVYLIKTDENGNQQWAQTFGELFMSNNEYGYSLQQTTDGGYVIAGQKNGKTYLLKTNEDGVLDWEATYLETGGGNSVKQTIDGGYIITGQKNNDVHLLKTDENGNQQWSQNYGGAGYSEGYSVKQTADGGYIIAGLKGGCGCYSWNYYDCDCDGSPEEEFSEPDIYLIKTDSEGNVTFTNIIETPAIKKNLITTVDILGRETANNQGFQLHIYDDGSVEKKYLIK